MDKFARFNVEVGPKEKDVRERYITIEVRKNDPKMKIKVSKENKITVNLNLKLEVDALEYAHDELDSKKEIEKLNKALSKQLTKKARMTHNQGAPFVNCPQNKSLCNTKIEEPDVLEKI